MLKSVVGSDFYFYLQKKKISQKATEVEDKAKSVRREIENLAS